MIVQVWRLEHVKCKNSKFNGHGPASGNSCGEFYDKPFFGTIGLGPTNIRSEQVCGVTREQLPWWWSEDHGDHIRAKRARFAAAGWFFRVYSMDVADIRTDNGQIIFDKTLALDVTLMGWNVVPFFEGELIYSTVNDWHTDNRNPEDKARLEARRKQDEAILLQPRTRAYSRNSGSNRPTNSISSLNDVFGYFDKDADRILSFSMDTNWLMRQPVITRSSSFFTNISAV